MINRRLSLYANAFAKIHESQSGFRAGYSTIDNAFVLQTLISKILSKKRRKFYVGFIDFKTAYDSVDRSILWQILQEANIQGKRLNILKAMYENVKSRVRCSNGYTDYIDCKIGLKQGCLISPQLFSFSINELVQ